MADIKKFKFWAQKVLPAVYDDSLSYYEVLCKVVEYLNEVIDVCNSFDTDVSELQAAVARLNTVVGEVETEIGVLRREMTDFNVRFAQLEETLATQIATLQTQLEAQITSEINAKTTELVANISAEIARLNREVSAEIARLDAEVNAALAEVREVVGSLDVHIEQELARVRAEVQIELAKVQEALDGVDEYIDAQFQLLQRYIDDQFENLKKEIPEFENVMVVNPHTATLENIQKVVNDLYDLDRSEALTAGELDSLGLTASEIDNYIVNYIPRGLTAIEWDYKARIIFKKLFDKVFSIVSGSKVDPAFNIGVLEKCAKQGGSYNASEWDDLGKTASELDNLGISCYNIDWRSNTLVA